MNSKSSDTSDPELGILTIREFFLYRPIVVTPSHSVPGLEIWEFDTERRAEYLGACRPGAKALGSGTSAALRQSIQHRYRVYPLPSK